MMAWFRMPVAQRQLMHDTRLSGPMPWMLAIMMLLTILAAAAVLSIGNAIDRIGTSLERRMTIQIIEANPDRREDQRRAVIALIHNFPDVVNVGEIDDAEMTRLLEPWLGEAAVGDDLPLPVLIDAEIAPGSSLTSDMLAKRIAAVAPAARLDNNADTLRPVAKLLGTVRSLALMLMTLMLVAMVAAVMLAVRAALNTHRATIDVMHLMGATDMQVAGHFQRRAAIDALMGGVVGLVGAALVMLLLRSRVADLGSELVGTAGIGWLDWILLILIPLASAGLATLVARSTVIRTLRKML